MESLSPLVHKNSILYYLCLQVAKGHLFLIYRQHCEPFLLVFIFISIYCAAFEKRRTVFGNLLFYRMMKQTLFLPVQLIYREKNKFSFRNICGFSKLEKAKMLVLPYLRFLERIRTCQHLEFRLLTSRTVT